MIKKRHLGVFVRNKGAYLPIVMGVVVIVVLISAQMGSFITSHYQNLSTSIQQERAMELAKKSAVSIERLFQQSSEQPEVIDSITDDDGKVSILDNKVWADVLSDYKLTLEKDPISKVNLQWWQQPESWWKTYATTITTDQISADLLQQGNSYVVVEYLKKYDFNEDLSLRRNYSTGIYASVYRITAAGFSHDGQRTIVSSVYLKTYAF